MLRHPSDLSVREARAQYFAANDLGDGGYQDRWVKFKIGPARLWMPNTQARVAAARFHDLHHVLTGYDTSWSGEGQIAAWEIAGGCAHHYAAWLLNLGAMALGLIIDFNSVAEAFYRGLRSMNLYGEGFDETLLLSRVGDLQRRLGLDRSPRPPSVIDLVRFGAWAIMGCVTLAAVVVIIFLPIWLTLMLVF